MAEKRQVWSPFRLGMAPFGNKRTYFAEKWKKLIAFRK